jgi:hypothetical protein
MICEAYRCLFVHIPKTAGQSIERFFLQRVGLSWENRAPLLLRPNTDPRAGPRSLAHLTAAEYVELGYLSAEDFARYYKFAFVRNPWERLLSEYRYRDDYMRRYSFREFVLHGLPPAGWTDAYRHVVPQYDFLHDTQGRLLVDFVGRFERLQADFDRVRERLGIAAAALPHVNAARRSTLKARAKRLLRGESRRDQTPYTEYYDDETREAVTTLYRKDIDTFGYAFGE